MLRILRDWWALPHRFFRVMIVLMYPLIVADVISIALAIDSAEPGRIVLTFAALAVAIVTLALLKNQLAEARFQSELKAFFDDLLRHADEQLPLSPSLFSHSFTEGEKSERERRGVTIPASQPARLEGTRDDAL